MENQDHNGAIITAGGLGVAKSIYSAGQLVATIDNTVASAVTDVLVLKHSTTGTPANGIGVGVSIGLTMSLGTTALSNSSPVIYPNATTASRNVVPSLYAFFATTQALSYPMNGFNA